ncbi:MAG TPA: TonB-dependent receptor [Terriglobia bacterium]|nr:TonB-dependent receptor [Terriglobia bacterium]
MRTQFSALLAVVLLFAAQSMAQVYRGRIEGLITDPSGAVMPGAKVTLTNVNTGSHEVRQSSSNGLYLFDLLNPGTYTISIEATGFTRFVHENIAVQASSDITVNAVMQPGAVQQTVTVTSTPSGIQTNTSNQTIGINSTLAQNTPRYDRNPFKLTLLAPEAINTRGEMLPFLSWSANSVDLGGDTNLKNDLEVDGSPVGLGHKFSYPPNMDDVQETTIAQNGVDAEYGHSAGGVINITTKSGTNQWHGDAMYLGRYPWANAIYDRTTGATLSTRQNMYGGTLGNPIIKDKLFNFASVEVWTVGNPTNFVTTVPTAAQAAGDFSQTYNIDGSLATIYNPWSTTYNPNTQTYTRTPFPGNVIPESMMDPVASQIRQSFWAPNGPGVNITGVDNFEKAYSDRWTYYNYSDRVDYTINSKWKAFGRISAYHTTDITPNITPNNSQLYVPTGTFRTANQYMGDAIWSVNPTTVLDFHADYDKVVDAYTSTPMPSPGWASIWPNNPWYQPDLEASKGFPVYYPDLNIGGNGFGGRGFYWNQAPKGEALSADYSHQMGSHYIKAGLEWRHAGGPVFVSNTSQFYFNTAVTADTPVNPDTLHTGNPFATFLLGALDSQTEMISGPVPNPSDQYYGMYIQDDWRVNRRLTINLGLRNEYETAWSDANHELSQGLNLNATVPEMAANPPQMPAQAVQLVGSNFYSGVTKGLWQWTSGAHPGMWNAPVFALAPRAGFALKLTDRSVLRFGYARYVIPTEYNFTAAPFSGFEDVNFLEPPFFGMTGYQYALPLLQGVPQQTFADPFPANSNPLVPILGKAFGSNVGRGGDKLLWYPQNFTKAYNDRIDVNFQRQMPGHVLASVTYFLNLGHQHYTKELNAINPALEEKYQNALNAYVPNPFYQYLNTTVTPGPLFNEQTVPLNSLLVPYPQYGQLFTVGNCCNLEHYNQLQLELTRPFTNGLTFLFGYVYTRESTQINNFNDQTYYNNQFQWQESNQPHHRMNIAASYNLPFGRGQTFLHSASSAVNALIGGWRISPVLQYISGDYPQFGNMVVTGNPCVSNPTPGHWFNTSAFQPIAANTYVLRTNPLQFGCLTGPSFWDLDATLAKDFPITERLHGQLKMTAYNATNRLNRGDPDTNIYDSTFGQALFQGSPGGTFGAQAATEYTSGRQVELGFKLTW